MEEQISVEAVDKCAHYLAAAMVDTDSKEMKITLSKFSFRGSKAIDVEITVREKK